MAERFSNGLMESAVFNGDFGEYLKNPYSNEKRAEIVGCKLVFFRKMAKMSQKEVCEIIDCKPQTYSGYEKGKHEPTMETLVRLSWLYAVSLDYLLGRNELDDSVDDQGYIDNVHENNQFEEIGMQMELLKREFAEFKTKYKKEHPDE